MKKRRVTIRSKLILSHFLAIVFISGSVGTYFYFNAHDSLMRQLQDRLQYSAALLSRTLDANPLGEILGPSDSDKKAYQDTLRQLRAFRRMNKDIAYLYIMRRTDDKIHFVVDSDETDEQALPGTEYMEIPPEMYDGFVGVSVDAKIYTDEWGSFLSGYAPLMNGMGQYLLGIDMRADEVKRKFQLLRLSGIVSLFASIVLAFLFSQYLSDRFTSPIRLLISRCRTIADGRLEEKLAFETNDEINDLIDAFNSMADQLSSSERKKQEAFVALQKSRDELEIRVEQRTRDLKEINERMGIEMAERIRAQKALEEAAMTDPLTGLLNRRAMMAHLQHQVARNRRNRVPFTILLADLDHFKAVNDTNGHDAGDIVLVETAKRFSSLLRGQDIVARWGGEEFFILLPETPAEGGLVVAEKIRKGIAGEPFYWGGKTIFLTTSVGVAAYDGEDALHEYIRKADAFLYKAKHLGRNRVEWEKPES
ncbi:MAG TPA: diguanylate cyclase [Syntrophales bacterium]|nr:diguanylate cyclase [Syntrophales bacterium]